MPPLHCLCYGAELHTHAVDDTSNSQTKESLGPIWDRLKLLCIERLTASSFLFSGSQGLGTLDTCTTSPSWCVDRCLNLGNSILCEAAHSCYVMVLQAVRDSGL